jgi:hypothetical protein
MILDLGFIGGVIRRPGRAAQRRGSSSARSAIVERLARHLEKTLVLRALAQVDSHLSFRPEHVILRLDDQFVQRSVGFHANGAFDFNQFVQQSNRVHSKPQIWDRARARSQGF